MPKNVYYQHQSPLLTNFMLQASFYTSEKDQVWGFQGGKNGVKWDERHEMGQL